MITVKEAESFHDACAHIAAGLSIMLVVAGIAFMLIWCGYEIWRSRP